MKKLKLVMLALGCLLLLFHCSVKEDDPEPPKVHQVLVSYNKITSSAVSAATLDQLLTLTGMADSQITALTVYPVHVYKVIYKTTYRGVEKRASGAVIIPETNGTAIPLISCQHGTICDDKKAPSNYSSIFDLAIEEMFVPQVMSACGFICSVPDYLGFGESGDVIHPYHHQESTANACVDMLRAVKELCQELKVNVQEKCFLTGYSEGGYATLATLKKLQANYTSQFPITACTAGSGAYDLLNSAIWYLQQPTLAVPFYPCFVFSAYQSVYGWNRSLCEIIQAPYCNLIEAGLFDGTHAEDQIDAQLTSQTQDLFKPAFLAEFLGGGEQTIKTALQENSVYLGWFPTCPTRLYHGTADDIVPPFNSLNALQAFVAAGATKVTHVPLPGLDHGTAVQPYLRETILWFKSL